jgi:hypothetical protein
MVHRMATRWLRHHDRGLRARALRHRRFALAGDVAFAFARQRDAE